MLLDITIIAVLITNAICTIVQIKTEKQISKEYEKLALETELLKKAFKLANSKAMVGITTQLLNKLRKDAEQKSQAK